MEFSTLRFFTMQYRFLCTRVRMPVPVLVCGCTLLEPQRFRLLNEESGSGEAILCRRFKEEDSLGVLPAGLSKRAVLRVFESDKFLAV